MKRELVKQALLYRAKIAAERNTAPLTDEMLKGMVPMFVDEDSPDDHKCGTCFMRSGSNECTIVSGPISFKNGVCSFWAKGPASKRSKIHENRMTYDLSGYVEVPPGKKINCASCRFFDNGHCMLWNGKVLDGQCCIAWSGPHEYVPEEGEGGE